MDILLNIYTLFKLWKTQNTKNKLTFKKRFFYLVFINQIMPNNIVKQVNRDLYICDLLVHLKIIVFQDSALCFDCKTYNNFNASISVWLWKSTMSTK